MASGLESYFDRKPSSTIRPGLAHLQADPSSPHTPQRTFSSTFSSPSISYRSEEEAHVVELGAVHLSAGLAGEPSPRCSLSFGPEDSRRVGDYRQWLPGYERPIRKHKEDDWSRGYELWRMDLRDVDLGLVEDKIERAVRDVYTKYLLMDQKSRRLLLVLPSIMPHQLLSSLLAVIFLKFQYPSITLFSTPIVNAIAAGCRSGLIVDVGFAETVITAIYEYREVLQRRTTRASKRVMVEMVKMLRRYAEDPSNNVNEIEDDGEPTIEADFETAEDITARMAWCPMEEASKESPLSRNPAKLDSQSLPTIREDSAESSESTGAEEEDRMHEVPSPFKHGESLNIPFSQFAEPVVTAILAVDRDTREIDDQEQPVHLLIFKALLALPPDVRAVCMSRIIFTGGGSNIPGLKTRLLSELSALVAARGWDPVAGKAADKLRGRLKEIKNVQRSPRKVNSDQSNAGFTSSTAKPHASPASMQEQIHDPIEEKLRHDHVKGSKPLVSGVIRGIETLGPWAGGSLAASLKIRGTVEIDRDAFLQHGLAGARKDKDANPTQTRQSFGPNMPKPGSEKPGWTLGGWA